MAQLPFSQPESRGGGMRACKGDTLSLFESVSESLPRFRVDSGFPKHSVLSFGWQLDGLTSGLKPCPRGYIKPVGLL